MFCISFYYSVIVAFPSTISSYGVDIGTLMSRPDTSVVVIYIPSPRRTDIVHALGVRLFQDKSVRQHKILRYRLSLQRLLLVIFKRVASDTRWNPSWPRCVLSSWSWWWSGLIHIMYTVLTAILLSAIDSLSSNLSHFPAGKPLHFCRHMISTGIQNNRHGSSIAVIYILMPRRTKTVRAVGFLAFSASCMGRRLKVATSVVYSQQSAFNPLIRGLCRNWLGRKALSI